MTDINQTNNKETQVSEFENLLQVYTEHTLKNDSSLPPQTRVVKEQLDRVENILAAKDTELDSRVSFVEKGFEQLNSNITSKVDSSFDTIIASINTEVTRAKNKEKELSDRISTEKERLDDFFKAAEVGEIAIDTLVEIQKWIEDDETDTANLLVRVGSTEDNLSQEISNREQAINDLTIELSNTINTLDKSLTNTINTESDERKVAINTLQENLTALETTHTNDISTVSTAMQQLDTDLKAADTEINTRLTSVSDRVELLEREVVLISCGNSKF